MSKDVNIMVPRDVTYHGEIEECLQDKPGVFCLDQPFLNVTIKNFRKLISAQNPLSNLG